MLLEHIDFEPSIEMLASEYIYLHENSAPNPSRYLPVHKSSVKKNTQLGSWGERGLSTRTLSVGIAIRAHMRG